MSNENKLPRAFTVRDLLQKKFNVLNFEGVWLDLIGKPELRGSWIVYGLSFQGKTRFVVQLASYLSTFGKVIIDSLEEGFSRSMQTAFEGERIPETEAKIQILDQEPIPVLIERLKSRQSAKFVIIDSAQYTFIDKLFYKENLLKQFPDKIFIFTSHATGKDPKGALAEAIWYDSFVKLRVEGFRVFSKSRYGGGVSYDIWPEEAKKYHASLDFEEIKS